MQKQLEVIKQMREFGVQAVVEKYKLEYKDAEHKFLVKYHQIDSAPYRKEMAVRESRGLVVLKSDLSVLAFPFLRFYNHDEPHSEKTAFNESKFFKKEDGSLITKYFDPQLNVWCVASSGDPDAGGIVWGSEYTFKQLFDLTAEKMGLVDDSKLDKNLNYVFELCTPLNVVVCPHKEYYLALTNVRNIQTMEEHSYEMLQQTAKEINIPIVEDFSFDSVEQLKSHLATLPYHLEGYVSWDGKNREKWKGLAYIIAHQFKNAFSPRKLVNVIQIGEKDEVGAIMEDYKYELEELETFLKYLADKIKYQMDSCLMWMQQNPNCNRKDYALHVQKTLSWDTQGFAGGFYNLFGGKMFDPKAEMFAKGDKHLYQLFTKAQHQFKEYIDGGGVCTWIDFLNK